MKNTGYSLILVYEENDGIVTGTWLQDVTGNLEKAKKCAKETEQANSNRITVGVVERVDFGQQYDLINKKRLA